MQRYLLIASLCLLAGMGIASPATQVPNKLFDVRNGNGLVLDGTTSLFRWSQLESRLN